MPEERGDVGKVANLFVVGAWLVHAGSWLIDWNAIFMIAGSHTQFRCPARRPLACIKTSSYISVLEVPKK